VLVAADAISKSAAVNVVLAERTVGKSRTNFFMTNSAMGLRQMFPWQTNKILIICFWSFNANLKK
jgi:hypothetical protein